MDHDRSGTEGPGAWRSGPLGRLARRRHRAVARLGGLALGLAVGLAGARAWADVVVAPEPPDPAVAACASRPPGARCWLDRNAGTCVLGTQRARPGIRVECVDNRSIDARMRACIGLPEHGACALGDLPGTCRFVRRYLRCTDSPSAAGLGPTAPTRGAGPARAETRSPRGAALALLLAPLLLALVWSSPRRRQS